MQSSQSAPSRYGTVFFSILLFAVCAGVLFSYSRPLASAWIGFDKALAHRAAALAVLMLLVPFIAALKCASAQRVNEIAIAFAVACLVSGVAFAFVSKVNHAHLGIPLVLGLGVFMAGMFFTVTIVPAALTAWFAEYTGMRSVVFYIGAGAGIVFLSLFIGLGGWQKFTWWLRGENPDRYGLLGKQWFPWDSPDAWWLVAAGALGGLIYWASTGRNAGAWRSARAG